MTLLPNQNRTPIKTNLYDLIQDSIPKHLGRLNYLESSSWYEPAGKVFTLIVGGAPLEVNSYILNSTSITEKYNGSFPHSLYTNKILHESVLTLTQILGPLVAHHQLRNETQSQTTGSRLFEISRLRLSQPVCIASAVLSALSAFGSLWAILNYRGAFRTWDKDPATILGLMAFSRGQELHSSPEQREARSRLWTQFLGSPLPLPTWLRLTFTIYVSGLIVTLVVMLRKSDTSDGIMTLQKGALSLWWTVVPTLTIYLVTLYTTSSDTVIRDLATYAKLSVRSCTMKELNVSLLDMLGFRALYYSLRWKIYTVTLSQLLAIACGFLAPFSSLLFTSENIPGRSYIDFKQQSWFGSRPQAIETEPGKLNETMRARYAVNGLLVTQTSSNFTWPAFTYRNLAFPRLEVDGPSQDWKSGVSFELEAPAIQLRPECRQLSPDIFRCSNTHYSLVYVLRADIPRTCPNGTTINTDVRVDPVDDTFFLYELALDNDPCPADYWMERTYAWGYVKKNITYRDGFDHIAIWSCNYTWAEVPTKMHMLWTTDGSLQVDHLNPPSPDYSRARPLYPPLKTPGFNKSEAETGEWPDQTVGDGRGGPQTTVIDNRFSFLFSPIGSLNVLDLVDPSKDQQILQDLHYGTSVTAAQLANALNRLDINETSVLGPERPGELTPIRALVTDSGRLRLVQNSQMTYLIVSILCLGLFVNACALVSTSLRRFTSYRGKWLLDLEMRDLVPSDYNSIAMSAALLAPSNYPEYMGSLDGLYTGLADRLFRMGGFIKRGGQERELTIGVLDDPEFVFLGKKQANR